MRYRRHAHFVTESELAESFRSRWTDTSGQRESWPEVCGADIVLRDGDHYYAVEAKLQFSLHLLEQAVKHRHSNHFHGVFILVPAPLDSFQRELAALCGLGIASGLPLVRDGLAMFQQRPVINPNAKLPDKMLALLNEDAKRFTKAGVPSPSGMSEWHHRLLKLGRFALSHPGMTLRELLNAAEPRYHKKTHCLLGPKKQDYDYLNYLLANKKCKHLALAPDGTVTGSQWLIDFDKPTQ